MSRTLGCFYLKKLKRMDGDVYNITLIMEYMIGWVNIGSSISLCPNFLYPTRSITTSLCQVALHSAAILATSITASGSSAFTWKIGALTTRPTSVQYGLDLEYLGSVVNPIWLLATMWTVPLIKKNGFDSLKFCTQTFWK